MASGRPSSRGSPVTFLALSLVNSKSSAAACALSANSRTEAYCCALAVAPSVPASGTGSVRTGNSCSPLTRSTIRLVTSATTPGAAPSRVVTSGAASVTCSKLSSSSNSCREYRYDSRSLSSLPPDVLSPSPAAIAAATRSAAGTADRSNEPHSVPEP